MNQPGLIYVGECAQFRTPDSPQAVLFIDESDGLLYVKRSTGVCSVVNGGGPDGGFTVANNGLYSPNAITVRLGGPLIENTTIDADGFNFVISDADVLSLSSTGNLSLTSSAGTASLFAGTIATISGPTQLRVRTPDVIAATAINGQVLTLIDVTTGESEFTTLSIPAELTFDNGLTRTVNNVQWGGALIQDTTIDQNGFATTFTTDAGSFNINTDIALGQTFGLRDKNVAGISNTMLVYDSSGGEQLFRITIDYGTNLQTINMAANSFIVLNDAGATNQPGVAVGGTTFDARFYHRYANIVGNVLFRYDNTMGIWETILDADLHLTQYMYDNAGGASIKLSASPTATSYLIANGGSLHIGGSANTADSVLVQLTSTTKAFRFNSMTTAERDALTASNGMQIYNSTTDKMQVREAGAWVDIV